MWLAGGSVTTGPRVARPGSFPTDYPRAFPSAPPCSPCPLLTSLCSVLYVVNVARRRLGNHGPGSFPTDYPRAFPSAPPAPRARYSHRFGVCSWRWCAPPLALLSVAARRRLGYHRAPGSRGQARQATPFELPPRALPPTPPGCALFGSLRGPCGALAGRSARNDGERHLLTQLGS